MFIKAKDLFKNDWEKNRIYFCVTEEDVQIRAQQIHKRKLTEEELKALDKDIEETFSSGMMDKIDTAINLNVPEGEK
jgi:hypothetical protein